MTRRLSSVFSSGLRGHAVTQLRGPSHPVTAQLRNSATVLVLALAVACATTDSPAERAGDEPRTRYSSESGPTPVGVIPDATLRDSQRGKDLVLSIDYPTGAGPHPAIIFSHGAGGSSRGYVGLSSHWASYGYVVIKPSHRDTTRVADITPADFPDRIADIRFLIDSIPALEQKYPELKGKIDSARIGVGGHSLGAMTAMLIGGARTYPGPRGYADPRVKAIVAMSPQGPRESWGLTRESWAELRVPAMFMTGDRDEGIDETETPEWRREAFELSPPGDKWLVFIQGAGHLAFTGRLGVMPEETRRGPTYDPTVPSAAQVDPRSGRQPGTRYDPVRGISGTIKSTALAFWDAYLRGDASGREHLDTVAGREGVEVKKK